MDTSYFQIINALTKIFGEPESTSQNPYRKTFSLENPISLTFQYLPSTRSILFFSAVGLAPQTTPHKLYRQLLEANTKKETTAGGTFGLLQDGKTIVLCREEPLESFDFKHWEKLSQAFAQKAFEWSKHFVTEEPTNQITYQPSPLFPFPGEEPIWI